MEKSSTKSVIVIARDYQAYLNFICTLNCVPTDFKYVGDGEALYGYDRKTKLLKLKGWREGPCGTSRHITRFCIQYSFNVADERALCRLRKFLACTSM